MIKFIGENGQLSSLRNSLMEPSDLLEDMDPKLGELIYSDQPPTT